MAEINNITTPDNSTTTSYITYSGSTVFSDWDSYLKYKNELHKCKESHFSGFFSPCNLIEENVYVKEVIYSNPATIVFWSDGTKTVSKCHEGDEYSPECGFILCVLKKLIGPMQVRELLKDWISYDQLSVKIKDVRNKHRDDK